MIKVLITVLCFDSYVICHHILWSVLSIRLTRQSHYIKYNSLYLYCVLFACITSGLFIFFLLFCKFPISDFSQQKAHVPWNAGGWILTAPGDPSLDPQPGGNRSPSPPAAVFPVHHFSHRIALGLSLNRLKD